MTYVSYIIPLISAVSNRNGNVAFGSRECSSYWFRQHHGSVRNVLIEPYCMLFVQEKFAIQRYGQNIMLSIINFFSFVSKLSLYFLELKPADWLIIIVGSLIRKLCGLSSESFSLIRKKKLHLKKISYFS